MVFCRQPGLLTKYVVIRKCCCFNVLPPHLFARKHYCKIKQTQTFNKGRFLMLVMEFLIKSRCFQFRIVVDIEDICLGISVTKSQTRRMIFWGLTTSFIIINSWKIILSLCWLHRGNGSLPSWSLCYFSQLTLFQRGETVFVCLFRGREGRERENPKNLN